MQTGNAAILILVGIVVLWVIISGKGNCLGGALDCMMQSTSGSAPALSSALPSTTSPLAPIAQVSPGGSVHTVGLF